MSGPGPESPIGRRLLLSAETRTFRLYCDVLYITWRPMETNAVPSRPVMYLAFFVLYC